MKNRTLFQMFFLAGALFSAVSSVASTKVHTTKIKYGRPTTSLPADIILMETVGVYELNEQIVPQLRDAGGQDNINLSVSTVNSVYYLTDSGSAKKTNKVMIDPEMHLKLMSDLEQASYECPSRVFISKQNWKIVESSTCQPLEAGLHSTVIHKNDYEYNQSLNYIIIRGFNEFGEVNFKYKSVDTGFYYSVGGTWVRISTETAEKLRKFILTSYKPVLIFNDDEVLVRVYEGHKLTK